jgi:hypothetical protein
MLRAAVIWRVPALRMSDVRAQARPNSGDSDGWGRFGHRFQQETSVNSPLELGPKVWLSCPDRSMPIVHPPALPTGLRANPQLANTRPPLQTTICRYVG